MKWYMLISIYVYLRYAHIYTHMYKHNDKLLPAFTLISTARRLYVATHHLEHVKPSSTEGIFGEITEGIWARGVNAT